MGAVNSLGLHLLGVCLWVGGILVLVWVGPLLSREFSVVSRRGGNTHTEPLLAVVLRPGAAATAEELVAHCRAGLAPFKAPRTIELRDALPRSTVGKVLRRVLRDEAAARAAGAGPLAPGV